MKGFFVKSICLFMLLISQAVIAGPWEDFAKNFDVFMDQIEDFEKKSERKYLSRKLHSLQEDLYNIRVHKIRLLKMVIDQSGSCGKKLADLKKDVLSAQENLDAIGARFSKVSNISNILSNQIDNVLFSRKSWLGDIQSDCKNVTGNTLEEGQIAIDSLAEAQQKLESFLNCGLTNQCSRPLSASDD